MRVVLDLDDRRPIFALPDWVVRIVREALPEDAELVVADWGADGTGDGSPDVPPAALEAVRDAEVYLGFGVPEALLREGRSLRWVHSGAAGVGGSLTPAMLERDVVFTNSAGIHGPPVAETVLGFLLHFARGLDHAVRGQARAAWDKSAFDAVDAPVRELGRSTVGIVGLGGIGREVAWRAAALGASVVATRRQAVAGAGPSAADGVRLLTGPDALGRLLEVSDYVVLTVPETPRTRGLIDARALERMGPDAVLVNVARGRVVDEDALVDALNEGRLRGAALDALTMEPLPADHPLWRTPRTLITPHTSAYTHAFWEREAELILDNLRRYLADQPLRNVVDKEAGY